MKALRMLVLILLAAALVGFAAPPATDCPPGSPDCPLEPPQTVEINPNPRTADGELAPVEEPGALTPVNAVIPMPPPTYVDVVPLPERAPYFETLDVGMRYQGEGDVSCGVQALGMALQGLGAPAPASSALMDFLQQNGMFYDFGTGVEELAYAAQAHGYAGAYAFHNWDMEMLADEIAAGHPVVAALGANGEGQPGHFVTVTGISADGEWVAFNDPTLGEQRMPIDEFAALWGLQGNSGVRVALDAPVTSAGEMDLLPWVAFAAGVMALVTQFPWGQRREGIGGALALDEKGENVVPAPPHTTVKDPPPPRWTTPPRDGNRPLTQPARHPEPIDPPAPASPPRIAEEVSLVGGGMTEDEEGLLVHGVAQTGPAREGMEIGEETNPPAALLTGVMQDAGALGLTGSTVSPAWGQEAEGILSLGIALGFLEEPISPPIEILDPPAEIPPSVEHEYDEKYPPAGITWDPFLNVPLALIVNSDGEFVSETNGAQYDVISGSYALCGQVALAAILRITYPWLTAEDVVRRYAADDMKRIDPNPNYTFGWQLSAFVNLAYGDAWTAQVSGLRYLGAEDASSLPPFMRQVLAEGTFILALVDIANASSRYEDAGRVGETDLKRTSRHIPHWVVITGLSAQWDYDHENSPLNWVRVFNPFDNQIEYYKWEDFRAAWEEAWPDYRMVLVSRI